MRKVRKIFDLLESHQTGRNSDVSCLRTLLERAVCAWLVVANSNKLWCIYSELNNILFLSFACDPSLVSLLSLRTASNICLCLSRRCRWALDTVAQT